MDQEYDFDFLEEEVKLLRVSEVVALSIVEELYVYALMKSGGKILVHTPTFEQMRNEGGFILLLACELCIEDIAVTMSNVLTDKLEDIWVNKNFVAEAKKRFSNDDEEEF